MRAIYRPPANVNQDEVDQTLYAELYKLLERKISCNKRRQNAFFSYGYWPQNRRKPPPGSKNRLLPADRERFLGDIKYLLNAAGQHERNWTQISVRELARSLVSDLSSTHTPQSALIKTLHAIYLPRGDVQRSEVEHKLYMEVHDLLDSWITRGQHLYGSVTERWPENGRKPPGISRDFLTKFDRNNRLDNVKDYLYGSVEVYCTQLTVEQLAREIATNIKYNYMNNYPCLKKTLKAMYLEPHDVQQHGIDSTLYTELYKLLEINVALNIICQQPLEAQERGSVPAVGSSLNTLNRDIREIVRELAGMSDVAIPAHGTCQGDMPQHDNPITAQEAQTAPTQITPTAPSQIRATAPRESPALSDTTSPPPSYNMVAHTVPAPIYQHSSMVEEPLVPSGTPEPSSPLGYNQVTSIRGDGEAIMSCTGDEEEPLVSSNVSDLPPPSYDQVMNWKP